MAGSLLGSLRRVRFFSIVVVLLALAVPYHPAAAHAQAGQDGTPVATSFSPPLGFRDGLHYAAKVLFDSSGQLVENTGYGVQNPDMAGPTCFGVGWNLLYHTGEDLYRADGGSTAGAEVTAIADGRVVYASPYLYYPGRVIIIEHLLSSGETVYSMYGHLNPNSVDVIAGQTVARGQRLGTVMYQAYSGAHPALHPSRNDSHLHFEIRHFLDARMIYGAYPACDGIIPGRGYTYPQQPDNFPSPGAGYINPSDFLAAHS